MSSSEEQEQIQHPKRSPKMLKLLHDFFMESYKAQALDSYEQCRLLNGIVYNVGDVVAYTTNLNKQSVDLIGAIRGIYYLRGKSMSLIALNVYFRKSELPQLLKHPFICSNELFPSDWTIVLPPMGIVRKLTLMSEQLYQTKNITDAYTQYMSRAKFTTNPVGLVPPTSQWKKVCVCDVPVDYTLEYVFCEKCQKWFHNIPDCTGMPAGLAREIPNFNCQECKKPKRRRVQE